MATRTALLAVLAVLVVAPAAQAQSFDEQSCGQTGAPRGFCVGMGKLGERASAECRRLGIVGDENCWSRVGRRVIRAEVAEFERTHTARTLRFQHRLGNRLAFSDAPWVGTHNSYNSTSEDPTLSHTDSNQQLGLADQLRLGARSLEIDVHWLPSLRAGGADAAVLCHGQGAIGCTTERLLSERLPEVRAWLDEHPRQVVLLYLEDQIDNPAGYEATAAVVGEVLGDRLYRPRGEGCVELPLALTRRVVREAGAQVVVVSDCGSGAWQTVAHSWPGSVRFEDRARGYQPFPACGPPDAAESAAKIVRYYEDSTFLSHTPASSPDDGLTPDTVGHMVRCGVDLFGFDQLLPHDPRLDALVWSWADGQPRKADRCTIQRPNGRWATAACTELHRPACRAADGTWTVLAVAAARPDARAACSAAGLALDTPRTGAANHALRLVAGADPVWLRYRRQRDG